MAKRASVGESVALFGIGQQFGAAVIEQDDVELLRAVAFTRLARAAVHGVVAGHGLAGAGGCQHWKKQSEILKTGQQLLDPDNRNMNPRQ